MDGTSAPPILKGWTPKLLVSISRATLSPFVVECVVKDPPFFGRVVILPCTTSFRDPAALIVA
jgi:hypothetical protein